MYYETFLMLTILAVDRVKSDDVYACKHGLIYEDSCFFTVLDGILQDSYIYDYENSQKICQDLNANLAYIDSEATYEAVTNYLRSLNAKLLDYTHFWWGATYQDNTIVLNNGEKMKGNMKWLLGYPLGNSSHMAIQIAMNPDSIYQGIFNFEPTSLYQPICQKSLKKRHEQQTPTFESTVL